jgi:hypothetical protein
LQETEIRTKSSDRSQQQRINLVKQEILAIQATIERQQAVLDEMVGLLRRPGMPQTYQDGPGLRRANPFNTRSRQAPIAVRPRPYAGARHIGAGDFDMEALPSTAWGRDAFQFSRLASTDPGGFYEMFAGECNQILDGRAREFKEYDALASSLESVVRVPIYPCRVVD